MNSILNMQIDEYEVKLKEPYYRPNNGDKKMAIYHHIVTVKGVKYRFQAVGSQKWIYKRDTVSFEYFVSGDENHIMSDTIVTKDKDGYDVCRGKRVRKKQLRTAYSRIPANPRLRALIKR